MSLGERGAGKGTSIASYFESRKFFLRLARVSMQRLVSGPLLGDCLGKLLSAVVKMRMPFLDGNEHACTA